VALESVDLAEPPADLSAARQAFWKEWAPRAIAEGTLTAATVLGFRELSEQYVVKADLATVVEARGPSWDDALKLWLKATQRLDSSMARFKLTAMGKAAAPTKAKPAANPWAVLGTPASK
jgi:hypothetical protein